MKLYFVDCDVARDSHHVTSCEIRSEHIALDREDGTVSLTYDGNGNDVSHPSHGITGYKTREMAEDTLLKVTGRKSCNN